MPDNQVNVKFTAETSGALDGIARMRDGLASLSDAISGPARQLGTLASRLREGLERTGTAYTGKLQDFGSGMAAICAQALGSTRVLGASLSQLGDLRGVFALPAGSGIANAGDKADAAAARRDALEASEAFAAAERLKIQEAKGDSENILAVYDEWLARVADLYGRDSRQYLDLERQKVAAAQRAATERLQAAEQEQRQEEKGYNRAATEAAYTWANTADQISDRLAGAASEVLTGTKSIGAAFDQLARSMLKDFLRSTIGQLLGGSKGPGGLSSLLFGSGGLQGLLGLGPGGLFGLLGASLGLGGATEEAIDTAAMWGGGGEAEVLAGLGGAVGAGPGQFGGLLGWLGDLLGLARGGIVPSAGAGWAVPHFAQGGILSVLHQREMVLPAPISEGLQSMIADGGVGGHTFNMNISAWDARSVVNAGPQIVAAINRALRNGSTLCQPS
jgi:hypothetical protein